MPPVCAERKAEPLGRGFLLERGIEVGEIEDATQFLVPRADEQRRRRLGQKRLQIGRALAAASKRERINGLSARRSGRRKSLSALFSAPTNFAYGKSTELLDGRLEPQIAISGFYDDLAPCQRRQSRPWFIYYYSNKSISCELHVARTLTVPHTLVNRHFRAPGTLHIRVAEAVGRRRPWSGGVHADDMVG